MHGHVEAGCPYAGPLTGEHTVNFLGKSYGQLRARFRRQCAELRSKHGVEEIVEVFECQWDKFKEGKDLGALTGGLLEHRPLERLAPRVALRGGRCDAFVMRWSAKQQPGRRLYYVDYNSL